MKKAQYHLGDLVEQFSVKLRGSPNHLITGLASLRQAKPGQLSFFYSRKFLEALQSTQASAIIIKTADADLCRPDTHILLTENPRLLFAKIAKLFLELPETKPGIHPSAMIGHHCHIDDSAMVGANCVIGDHVTIGQGSIVSAHSLLGNQVHIGQHCYLWPKVTIQQKVHIGNQVTIHSGVVIGSDGFGFTREDTSQWVKIPHLGGVHIGNQVEIGANTTIDRGTLEDTYIGDGVKIDNQVQVAHNVSIGANTIIAGCSAIGGSTHIGKHCIIGGAVSFSDNITVADGSFFTGTAMVTRSIHKPGMYSSGTGLQTNSEWRKNVVRFRQLDSIVRRLNLSKKVTS